MRYVGDTWAYDRRRTCGNEGGEKRSCGKSLPIYARTASNYLNTNHPFLHTSWQVKHARGVHKLPEFARMRPATARA